MSVTVPRRGSAGENLGAVAVWTLVAACGLLLAGTNIAERVAGPNGLPGSWFAVTLGVLHAPGTPVIPWTAGCTVVAVALALALAAPVVAGVVWWSRRHRRRERVDQVTEHLADRRDLRPITRAGAVSVARQLGAPTDRPGLPLARTLDGADLFQDGESTSADIWGTRRGKARAG